MRLQRATVGLALHVSNPGKESRPSLRRVLLFIKNKLIPQLASVERIQILIKTVRILQRQAMAIDRHLGPL